MLHSLWLPRGCINSKHCLPLCATGLEVGDNSVEKMLFSKTILFHSTTPYLGYFLCILVVRFLMRGHLSRVSKAYQTTKTNFISRKKLPIFKLLPFPISCSLFCQLQRWPWDLSLPHSLHIGSLHTPCLCLHSAFRYVMKTTPASGWERGRCLPQY